MSENKPSNEAAVLAGLETVELKRIIQDADFQVLLSFLFRAMALQHEKPELADLFTAEEVADVRLLYELLLLMQKAKGSN